MAERQTAQRDAIRRVLHDSRRPLAPQEIRQKAGRIVPGLGMATVYRAVKRMLAEGWLIAVEIPGEPPRYEPAGKGHHHHFYCRRCRKLFEVQGCPAEIRALTPRGFALEGHELVLYGRCAACRPEPLQRPTRRSRGQTWKAK